MLEKVCRHTWQSPKNICLGSSKKWLTAVKKKNTYLHVPTIAAISLVSTSDLSQQTQKKTNKQTNKKGVLAIPFIADTLGTLTYLPSLARARNGGSLFQSNIRDLFLPGIWPLSILSGCPQGESWFYFCRPGNTSAFTGLWPHTMYIKDQI